MRKTMIPGLFALVVLGAACGDAATDDALSTDPIAAESPVGADEFPTGAAREEARGLLGLHEADLPDDARISRRGEEQFMLTEDYVLGRSTVELEDTDGSGFRVVTVTVELPDGPETFELPPS